MVLAFCGSSALTYEVRVPMIGSRALIAGSLKSLGATEISSLITGGGIKDNLVHDDMPKDMLDSILAYINEISENSIENIYLVRKIITDTFYSSAFIVKFKIDTKSDVIDAVMEKIFNHLDTHPSDAQFSLFLYDDINPKIVEKVENCCVFTAMPDGQA